MSVFPSFLYGVALNPYTTLEGTCSDTCENVGAPIVVCNSSNIEIPILAWCNAVKYSFGCLFIKDPIV